ncbi:hypothetical protein GWK47_009063 [Chionoecetes opilio]|uniref:Uncharacterized protein n=1 Tax=Chionoecetes opilio TaxID=41210 RepID=A0A8J5C438_CHIOP|nr:hypothetical protein GWK47_009063 [Chionoecetes opilio]
MRERRRPSALAVAGALGTADAQCHASVRQDGLDGASKRGCPKAREDELPAKRGGRQLCLEESFSRKDIVTHEVLRRLAPDHPTTRHFFSLLAPEFSAPSRRTLGREIDQVSATAKSDLFSMLHACDLN